MPSSFPTSPEPSLPLGTRSRARVKRFQFGDGYSQRWAEAINNIARTWNLTWESATASERTTVISFLEAQKGLSFNWTNPDTSTVHLVSCEEWEVDKEDGDVYTVKATFTEEVL